jgi:LysM repeat protein
MEEFNEVHTGAHSPFIMIAICLVALGLSSIALFIALTAANKPQDVQVARMQALESKLDAMETKTLELKADNARIHEHLKRLAQESQDAFNSVGVEMSKLHNLAKSNRDELEKMHNHLTIKEKQTPTPQKKQRESATATYTIHAGDTFASIAKNHGLSLQALINANPRLDPRNLRIGEVIELPATE